MRIESGILSDVNDQDIVGGTFKIPEGVTYIGNSAFSKCTSLTSIKIPEGVTEIGINAFAGCTSLTSIEIPEGVTEIGSYAFYCCTSLTSIKIPEGITEIGSGVFSGCTSLTNIEIPQNVKGILREKLYMFSGIPEIKAKEILFQDDYEKIEKIKTKAHFEYASDYDKEWMDIFYSRMSKSIGIDEIERMIQIPNLTQEEIKRYSLEKNDAFQELYDTKYKITGDLGITLSILKQLKLEKNMTEKNNEEIRIFRKINEKIEEGYNGSIVELVSQILEEEQIRTSPKFLERIRDLEKTTNKNLIIGNLEKVGNRIDEVLGVSSEEYPESIVQMQIAPIKAMIEEVIIEIFKETGKLDTETVKEKLEEKLSNARALYILQRKEQIIARVSELLEDEEFFNSINNSCLDAIKRTKQNIGGAWKYKINQSLRQLGYTFDNLPEMLSIQEIQKLQQILSSGKEELIEIETSAIAVPKIGIEREKAYKVLEEIGLPSIVTYQQIHDMFGKVHEPYSEKFKNFFKLHRKEFLENPRYYDRFGQIHNNFEELINSPKLKNLYQKGNLTIEQIIAYLETKQFANQRPEDEELARLAKSVGQISTEEEFAGVQRIFDITKKRERTTIPPITVTKTKYRGRMLSPDDVLNLFVGNITTCCQRFGDIGEGAMLLGSIEENGGIFVIEELDEYGNVKNIVGQSLTIRQKGTSGTYDRLTFDNIEITRDILDNMSLEDQAEILEIYKQAGAQAIEKDKRFLGKLLKQGKITQQQYDSLVLKEVTAGTGCNDLNGLEQLPRAEIEVPDEAYYRYTLMNGGTSYPWIDSAGRESPSGSDGVPVILASMDEQELLEIWQRSANEPRQEIKPKDIPLWYGKVGKVEALEEWQISDKHVEQIKQIERTTYRNGQQWLNEQEVQSAEDIAYAYDIRNMKVKLGSNKDWYLIYGEDESQITISDLAVIGGMHSEKNPQSNSTLSKTNIKLAIAEATNEMYGILIEAAKQNKTIYCNATADTSLVNIIRMLKKGLIQARTSNGRDVEYKEGKGLVYVEDGEPVETRDWDDDGEIQMLDLEIIPDIERLIEEQKRVKELLAEIQDKTRMAGTEKEQGLDELRREVVDTNDDR